MTILDTVTSPSAAAALAKTSRDSYFKNPNTGVTVYRYPENLATSSGTDDNEFPHYVMFYITKRQSDVQSGQGVSRADLAPNVSNRNNLINADAAKTFSSTAIVTGGIQAGVTGVRTIAKTFGGRAGPIPSGVGAVSGAAVANEVVDVFKNVIGGRERQYLKTAVALYLSDKPSSSYKAYWKDADIGAIASQPFQNAATKITESITQLGAAVSNMSLDGLLDAFKGAGSAVGDAFGGLGEAGAAYFLKNANKGPIGALGDIEGLVSSGLGVAVNPYTVQLFRNMGFRTFTFSYVFLPKNEAEYRQVQDIVKTFKTYMHPTKKANGIFLGYPGEFEIQYFYKGIPNEHLFKISGCALTDLKVEYGGGEFITFQPTGTLSGGAPAEITLSLSFTELEVLTEDRIREGY
jgi:hypothetical protein